MSVVDRINLLEAPKIDEECQQILEEQISQGFELFDSSLLARLKPELKLLINAIYYKYTIWKDQPLPGHLIQNIQFINGKPGAVTKTLAKKQKVLYFVLDVLGRYFYERFKIWLDNRHEDPKGFIAFLKKATTLLEKVYTVLDLFNFVTFLVSFKYRNLLERILRIRYSYIKENVSRVLDFEFMTRTIIWNVLSDFMSFCLPYIRYGFGEMAKKIFFFTTFMGSISVDLDDSDKKCAICLDEQVSMPFIIPKCKHKFCYVCIRTYINEHKGEKEEHQVYKCPKCRVAFSEIEPLHKREKKKSL